MNGCKHTRDNGLRIEKKMAKKGVEIGFYLSFCAFLQKVSLMLKQQVCTEVALDNGPRDNLVSRDILGESFIAVILSWLHMEQFKCSEQNVCLFSFFKTVKRMSYFCVYFVAKMKISFLGKKTKNRK